MKQIKSVNKELPVYYIIPVILLSALVPLIVHLKVITMDNMTFQFWTGEKDNADFFSYYKAIAIMIFSAAALLMFFVARYKGLQIRKQNIYYIPILSYAVLIVLSAAFSKYPNTSVTGFADRYEGVFVLLSYLLILFITINMINSVRLMSIIVVGLLLSSVVLGTIGVLQYFGIDFFQSVPGKLLILPETYRHLNLSFNFGACKIYSTLYNPNYVGSYTAMLFPLSLTAFLYLKKSYLKIGAGVLSCLMFANLIGSGSRAGYIGSFAAIILLIIFFHKEIIANTKFVVLLILAFLLIFVGMDSYAEGALSKEALSILTGTDNSAAQNGSSTLRLKDLKFQNNKFSVTCDKNTLNMELDGNQIIFRDTQDNPLKVMNNDGNITFADAGYEPYKLTFFSKESILKVTLGTKNFSLFIDNSGFKIIGERNTLVDKIDYPRSFGFVGREKFGSSRGYIWSRSIPLLANNMLIGGGPDTYAFQFPQHDYVGKLIALDSVNEIVDKPHNMYLQIGINTGVLSLLAVLFIFAVYAISSFKLYLGVNLPDKQHYMGIAFLTASIGYLITGLANDSLVSVAPVFWVVFGMGISCNFMVVKGNAA